MTAPTEWPTVSYESIVDLDPDRILWPTSDLTEDDVGTLGERPGWREVPAIRDGRVVLLDPELFNRPGARLAEAARVLARALHPEAF